MDRALRLQSAVQQKTVADERRDFSTQGLPRGVEGVRKATLIDLNWRHTGYLAAALHAAGIETLLINTAPPDRIGLGHYCRQVQSPDYTSPEYVPFVRDRIAAFRPDCVIPLCEPLIELFWNLDPPCPAPLYPPTHAWQREILFDRRRLYDCASAAGIPVAPWAPIGAAADLDRAILRFGFPLVIRGTFGFAGGQVRIVETPRAAHAAREEMGRVSPHPPFAQAFVRGKRQLIGGVFSQGEMIRLFAQETIEADPPQIGPSTRVRTVQDQRLEEHTRTLFRTLRWSGVACAEFVRNDAGEPVLMEVNPRPWGSIIVAEQKGAQIMRTFARLLAGYPPAPQTPYEPGVECLVLEAFVLSHRQAGIWSTLRRLEPRDLWNCALALPWSRPRLALHVLRRICQGLR